MLTKPINRQFVPGVEPVPYRAAFTVCRVVRPGPPGGGGGGGDRTRQRCEQKCTLVGYESGSITSGGVVGDKKPIYDCRQVCYTEYY